MKNIICLSLTLIASLAIASPSEKGSYLFQKETSYRIKAEGDFDGSKIFHIPEDGMLNVTGAGYPVAFIQTKEQYADFELQFDFRWPDKPGNSGIQLYSTDKPFYQIWPECVEVQMAHGNVGAFWLLGQTLETEPEQIPTNPDWKNKREFLQNAEKPAGEWNHMRIVSKDKTLEVYLNDVLVNRAWNVSSGTGKITIQAEESNINYRNFILRQL